MTKINTNISSLRGLRSVQKSTALLGQTFQRLSTGLQINSGKDNPSGLIGSETLRSQITAIEQSVKNSNRANNVIATADAALGEINGLLNQVRGLVQEGLNKGALSQTEINANQSQIDQALNAINRISGNASFAGDKLIDGSKAFTKVISSADQSKITDYSLNEVLFGSSSNVVLDTTVTTAATKGTLQYQGGALTQSTTIEIAGSKGSQALFFGSSSSYGNVVDAINNVKDTTGVTASSQAATAANLTLASSTNTYDDVVFTDARATTDNASGGTAAAAVAFTGNTSGSQALSISVSGTTVTVNLETDTNGAITSTASQVAAAVNADTSAAALVSADTTTAGTGVVSSSASTALSGGSNALLTLNSQNFGSKEFVDVNVLAGGFATTDTLGGTSFRQAGTDIVARINGQTAVGDGLKAAIHAASLDVSVTLAESSNVAATNAKITVTGGGSLFQIGQDVSAAGQIGIGIDAINTARLGGVAGKVYELGTGGGKSLLDVGPSVPGSNLVDIINQAIDKVSTLRGRLGAIQKNVIETNISSLGVALENISEARSTITDTDFAAETANLTKAQILQQSSLTVLQIANQAPNQILSLLR